MSVRTNFSTSRAVHGITMIEVLVAVLIVSIGLVSLMVLQTNTLKYQQGSSQRAQLSVLLTDYIERVRANLDQAPGVVGGSDYLVGAAWDDQKDLVESAKDCSETACNAAEQAKHDMAQWRAQVRQSLPRGSVFVQGTAARGITVAFMWADKELSGEGATLGAVADTDAVNGESVMAQASRCPADAKAPGAARCAVFVVMP